MQAQLESDTVQLFRHRLMELLRAHKRSEQLVFEHCYKFRHADLGPGEDDVSLLGECVRELGMSRRIVTSYRSWRRVRDKVPAKKTKTLDTRMVTVVGNIVTRESDIQRALEAAEKARALTLPQVRAAIEDADIPTESVAKIVTRESTQRYLRKLRAQLLLIANTEICTIVSELEEWAASHGMDIRRAGPRR